MPPAAIVVSFDHLHLGYLGCYGNDWIETPHFDRLAVEAVVFDLHFGENFDPHAAGSAWWTGRYQFPLAPHEQRCQPMLPDALRAAGVTTRLLIESGGETGTAVAPDFDEVLTLRGEEGMDVPEHEMPFARLVSRAVSLLQTPPADDARPSLLWLKSRGVPNPWIPPREFTDLYFDEFGLTEAPDDADTDLQFARALYASYVTCLDRWLGKLLAACRQHPWADHTLLIVTAAAGERLGERGLPGERTPVLHEELVHAPLLVRVPGSDQAASRRHALVQTVDLAPTLLDWFGISVSSFAADGKSLLPLIRNECESVREAALLGIGDRQIALRTPDFLYVVNRDAGGDASSAGQAQLFEKPDDRWEMADTIRQQPETAEQLARQLARVIKP